MGRIRWEQERIFAVAVVQGRRILKLICKNRILVVCQGSKTRKVDGLFPKKEEEDLHYDQLNDVKPKIK